MFYYLHSIIKQLVDVLDCNLDLQIWFSSSQQKLISIDAISYCTETQLIKIKINWNTHLQSIKSVKRTKIFTKLSIILKRWVSAKKYQNENFNRSYENLKCLVLQSIKLKIVIIPFRLARRAEKWVNVTLNLKF